MMNNKRLAAGNEMSLQTLAGFDPPSAEGQGVGGAVTHARPGGLRALFAASRTGSGRASAGGGGFSGGGINVGPIDIKIN